MHSKLQFARELKARAFDKQSVIDMGIWAYSVYLDKILCTMVLGFS